MPTPILLNNKRHQISRSYPGRKKSRKKTAFVDPKPCWTCLVQRITWVTAQTWERQATRATPTRVPDSTAGFCRVLTGSGIGGDLETSRDHVSSTVGSFGPQKSIGTGRQGQSACSRESSRTLFRSRLPFGAFTFVGFLFTATRATLAVLQRDLHLQ